MKNILKKLDHVLFNYTLLNMLAIEHENFSGKGVCFFLRSRKKIHMSKIQIISFLNMKKKFFKLIFFL